jgi:Membrane bound O-acyl transferase family
MPSLVTLIWAAGAVQVTILAANFVLPGKLECRENLARVSPMIRVTQSTEAFAHAARHRAWVGWIPLVALSAAACLLRARLAAWEFMWILSVAIFFGCKWETWFSAGDERWRARLGRNLGYLFFWPGMDASKFLATGHSVVRPPVREWVAATAKTLLGVTLVGFISRRPPSANTLVDGWIGMLGIILFLHFGIFHVLSLIWRRAGVDAQPIMRAPALSTSLSEFWGKRWNLGFRQLTHGLVFEPVRRRAGAPAAILAAFFVSGIIHDLVISFPARGGYGLPTAYFTLQGIGVLLEKSKAGSWLGIGGGIRGWVFVLICAGAPAYFLFHPLFIHRVMLPFFAFLGRL